MDTLIGKPKIGVPQSVTLEKHIDAYLRAHNTFKATNTRVHIEEYLKATSKEFYAWKHDPFGKPYRNIVIKGPDKELRDINLRPGSHSWYKENMPEFYRYSVFDKNGQVTLKMDIAQNTLGSRAGLEILKQYATNLLYTLGISEQDKKRYPKIEITGEGTKALYKERMERYDSKIGAAFYIAVVMFVGGAVAVAISLATSIPGGIFLLGLGIFAMLTGAVGAGGIGIMFSSPKKDLVWHENDLACRYNNYFSSRSSSINKPEAITPIPFVSGTNAEASPTSEPVVDLSASVSVSTPILTSSSDQKARGR